MGGKRLLRQERPQLPAEPAPEPAAVAPGGRWKRRGVTAGALRILAHGVPLVVAAATAGALVRWGRRPERPVLAVLWVVAVVALTAAAMAVGGRLGRRLLPLSALLRVPLAFPGKAPHRVRLGLGVGRRGDLDARLDAFRRHGLSEDPGRAATQAVALLAALAARHWGIWSHAERVALLSDGLAADLGVPAAERDRLRWGALLHDLGSLALDPVLPARARPLEGTDIRRVHDHPAAGARVAMPLRPWLGEWAATIDEHHERWDGEGYPRRLAGDRIGRGAAIVAVADAYDVMTSSSSYRPAVAEAHARAEIDREAGHQFDPVVAGTFLRRRTPRAALVPVPYPWRSDDSVWGRLRRPVLLGAGSAALVAAALAAGLPLDRGDGPAAEVAGRTIEPDPTAPAGPPASDPTAAGTSPEVGTIPAVITPAYAGLVMQALDVSLGAAIRTLVAAGRPTPAFDDRLAAIYDEPELSRKRLVYASEGPRAAEVLRPNPDDPVTLVDGVVRATPTCMVLAVRRDFSGLLAQPGAPPQPSFVALRARPPGSDRGPGNPTAWSMVFDGVTVDGRPPSAVC